MIEFIPLQNVSAQGLSGSELNGIDLLTSIQIMLVKDFDSQLKSLGKEMKGITKVKQAYREDIEKLQSLLTRKTEKVNSKGKEKKDGKETVLLTPDEKELLNQDLEYRFNTHLMELQSDPTTIFGTIEPYAEKKSGGRNPTTEGYYIEKDTIEKKLELKKEKLEALNEQSELLSLRLQSMTNQRKIAFETISNLVSKQHEGTATIVRNMRS